MPTVDSTRVAELKLAVGMQNLSDSLDLLNWATGPINPRYMALLEAFPMQSNLTLQGITFALSATGKASTTGEAPMQMDITIPLLIANDTDPGSATGAGDALIAAEQAIYTKIRQMRQGSGAFALNSAVYLWFRIIAASHYTYWSCFDAEWQPILLRQASDIKRLGILTLHCFPYSIGDPITDPVSTVLTPAAPQLYRGAIPGDARALTRLWITDLSGNSQIAQRLTLYGRSLDNMLSADWTATYAAVPVSPGAANTSAPTGALGGTYARLTTSGAWQTLSQIASGAGAFQSMTDADVIPKLRDAATPVGQPEGFTAVGGASRTGGLGNATYFLELVGRDGSGNAGQPTAQIPVRLNNLTQGSGGPYALNPLDFDFFLTNVFQNWIAPPLLTVGSGGGGVATGVLDTTAAVGNPFGYHAHAVGGVSAASSVLLQRILKPLPTSGAYGIRMPFVPITIANGRGGSPANATAEFNFITVAGGAGIGIQFDSSASVWRVCSANSNIGPSFTMPIAATTVNGNQSLPASTINVTSASSFLAASATAPHFAQIDGQLIQYTGKSGTTLTGCTGGTGTITNGHAVNQAFMLEFLFQSAGAGYSFTVSVDGAEASGYTASTQNFFQPQMLTIQAQAATGNANSEEFYVGEYDSADNAIGAGTSFNGGSITVNATSGPNTSTVDLYYFLSGGSATYRLPGVTLPYTLTQQLPPGVQIVSAFPSGAPAVQPTEVRIGYGTAATDLEYTDSIELQLSNGKWELPLVETIPLPPDEIPEGMLASPWVMQLQARNLGVTTPTIDNDEWFVIPHDGDSVTLTAPSTLSGPAAWMVDDRRDHRVSVRLYATAKVTAAGNEVSDATRAAASLDDGLTVPAGYGIYPNGTVLTHGTVGGAPRLQALATGQLNGTQAWFALTFIPGDTSANRHNFSWSSGSANEIIECYYDGGNFVLSRKHSGSGATASVAQALVVGTAVTVIGYWTASLVALSVNGSTFTTAANSAIPSGLGSNFDIGTRASIGSGSTDLYGAVQWFACGLGTPTQADAAIVATRGKTAPTLDDFSVAANLQILWSARMLVYMTDTVLGGADIAGEFAIGQNAIVAAYFEYVDVDGDLVADQQYQAMTIQASLRPRFGFARGSA